MRGCGCSRERRLRVHSKRHDDDVVMRLLEQALNKPVEDRELYLRKECVDDPELFQEVWKYIQWEQRMKSFLIEPLYPPVSDDQSFQPGELLIERFRTMREVGRGGMRIVYEASDERLGKRVALKCARPRFSDRLPPEVVHATKITHENVCKTFDMHTVRTSKGELDFITMEFLEGETLSEQLRR